MAPPALSLAVALGTVSPPAGELLVANGGEALVRVWEPGNSWGDAAWSFELARDGDVRPIRRGPQVYTRNVPSAREVAPGATERWAFDLGDGTWELSPGDVTGWSLTAVYDAPPSAEADELGVVRGPLRSEPVTLGR